ncbi:alkylphosphonate utilization protein [Fretibacter rubidus]|uniref:alkylphosphonate utilization protein n=1 Tax=Fretibacter rubidus TaxID=570162 RepID=UPI00352A8395
MSAPCPLCETAVATQDYSVPETPAPITLKLCENCHAALDMPAANAAHWQCLTVTMWSEVEGAQVTAYRIFKALPSEAFAQDALDMLYLDPDTQSWADSFAYPVPNANPTLDSNGTFLAAGDNVTLIKDLPVKGAGFTAKRGTVVRGISLTDNPEHIEGRVNGQRIVIISAFVKKG